jgi:hypothetical protein
VPVQCGTSVLTGQDGSIWFKPAGTSVCLLAADFNSTTERVTLPSTSDFRVGDIVQFSAEGVGVTLDTGLTGAPSAKFKINTIVGGAANLLRVSDGNAVNLAGDSATPAGGHINMRYADHEAICNVSMFDLNLTRNRIDITSLPCNFSNQAANKFSPFRTYQPGYADGTGNMTVKFTRDQTSLASRLLANSLIRIQDGANARLFIDTVVDSNNVISLAESNYIEVALSIEGMSFSVTTEDAPTEASINFSFQSQPTHLFYTSLV